MAELALKVGSVSANPKHYQDGDILCAFNSRYIRCVHAQHICHVKSAGGGRGVHRNDAHIARDWFEHTHQYRFERVSRTEIRRITLADLSEELINNIPRLIDGKMQYMHVEQYLARSFAHEGHKIFGSAGAEIWLGGRRDKSDAAMDLAWNALETKTDFREVVFTRWPAGTQDLKSHLMVLVDNFTDADAAILVAPEFDKTDPKKRARKRKRFVDWRDELPVQDHSNIDDRDTTVDLRDTMTPLVKTTVVKEHADL